MSDQVSSEHNVFSRDKDSISGFCQVCNVRGCKPSKHEKEEECPKPKKKEAEKNAKAV
jgi:hypothetical protein